MITNYSPIVLPPAEGRWSHESLPNRGGSRSLRHVTGAAMARAPPRQCQAVLIVATLLGCAGGEGAA